jgi:hypothetical protein
MQRNAAAARDPLKFGLADAQRRALGTRASTQDNALAYAVAAVRRSPCSPTGACRLQSHRHETRKVSRDPLFMDVGALTRARNSDVKFGTVARRSPALIGMAVGLGGQLLLLVTRPANRRVRPARFGMAADVVEPPLLAA